MEGVPDAPTLSAATKILSWQFPSTVGKLTLVGRSWAADSTGFMVPELELALDAGLVPHGRKPTAVLVTHTHSDHCYKLTHYKSRSKPPMFVLPESTIPMVDK